MKASRRRRILFAAGLLALATATAARAQTALENQVKAAFIAKFAAFVTWPPGVMTGSDPLRICVLGEDGLSRALQGASGQVVGDRAISVRQLTAVDRDSGCHLLYASGSPRQSVATALQAVQGAPVLTVTDATRGPERGMIHFVVFQNRVRFHIDAAQASRNGLSMNSKLLALGLSVKR